MKISFVIPSFNHWDLTHQILYDIYNTSPNVEEVLVINNGSIDKENYTGIQWWENTKMLPITDLLIEKNVGFLKACNVGVKEAKGDIIILVSNDVRIHNDILPYILQCMKIYKDRCIIGGKLYTESTGWNNFDGKIFPYLEGWLLAFTKDAWNEIGGFDPLYIPNDFEDIDFSISAKALGYTLISLPAVDTTHIGAQTISYGPEREALTEINREKFRKKWVK